MVNNIFTSIMAIIISQAAMVSAQAASVTWTLSDVTFSDGGSASGSFDYDADTNVYSAFSVSTTSAPLSPGEPEPRQTWGTNSSCASVFPASSASVLQCQDITGEFSLSLLFETELTNAGGTILLQPGTGRFGSKERRGLPTDDEVDTRNILTGSVVASSVVPVPAAVWLFGSGLIGLIGIARHKEA